jgi:hypothetical protein
MRFEIIFYIEFLKKNLDLFAELQKVTISFAMSFSACLSVCPSARPPARPPAWNISALTERISMKFGI